MSNLDICESSDDFWWSQKYQITEADGSQKVPVCNYAENELERINDVTLAKPINGIVEMPVKTEDTTENVTNGHDIPLAKNDKSVGKRPSGAQRRKRKWRRLESHTASLELNNVESGFKILNIDEFREDKMVIPTLSKTGSLNENIDPRRGCEKKFASSKFTKRTEHLLKSDNSCDKRSKSLAEDVTLPNFVNKRKYMDNSEKGIAEYTGNKNSAYSSVLKNKLHAVIFDESNIEGTLTAEQSDQIIDKLMTRLSQFTYASDSEVPRFQGYYLNKGVLTINCVNDKSLEWLINVPLNELWDGAKIKIMTANEFAKVIRMTAFIPGPIRENLEILKLLKTQNSELKTSRWRIYHRSQGTSTGMTLVLGVDEKSLEVLRSLEMKPYYGMSRAAFYLPDTKQGSSTRKDIPTEHLV